MFQPDVPGLLSLLAIERQALRRLEQPARRERIVPVARADRNPLISSTEAEVGVRRDTDRLHRVGGDRELAQIVTVIGREPRALRPARAVVRVIDVDAGQELALGAADVVVAAEARRQRQRRQGGVDVGVEVRAERVEETGQLMLLSNTPVDDQLVTGSERAHDAGGGVDAALLAVVERRRRDCRKHVDLAEERRHPAAARKAERLIVGGERKIAAAHVAGVAKIADADLLAQHVVLAISGGANDAAVSRHRPRAG